MEINKDNFSEAIQTDEFKTTLMPLIQGMDEIETLSKNKAELIYQERFDSEIKKVHDGYDDKMFEILGERPGQQDGNKQKTYSKVNELFEELKNLRGQKESLTKEAEVQRLTAEIEKLKTEGGASHVQAVFDKAKLDWETKENDYKTQIETMSQTNTDYIKKTQIQSAFQQVKFNPDTPESVRKMVLNTVEQELLKNSKIEGDKVVFLDKDGKPKLNDKYEVANAFEMISSMEAIKDISLKSNPGGGGADPTIEGSIETKSVDGKDTKKLILPEGSFKTKMEFQDVADKALMEAGISKNDDLFVQLKDQAYKDYKVAELPIQ